MNRYRALTFRYPHLTDAEHEERGALALTGWHEALTVGLGACVCQRQPGEDGERTLCRTCRAEAAAEEAEGLVTIADLLKPDTWDDAHEAAE